MKLLRNDGNDICVIDQACSVPELRTSCFKKQFYYMAGSASGQPERVRWAYLARSGLPALVPQKRNSVGVMFWPYHE